MKIVKDPSGYEVRIPLEIVIVVLNYISCLLPDELRLKTLWSCCLLSRTWYSAAVSLLYECPRLTNKNFDQFARIICPPVNSHRRRIGFETFVRRLDMGRLAYESTNSLTARMLRRTRHSLEYFVAPAVSFGINCLAPLSKCEKLRALDLSHDFYDIDLTKLLTALESLSALSSLSLPKSAMRKRCRLKPAHADGAAWPPKLSHLAINDWLPQDLVYWEELFASWPVGLQSVAFEECFNWNGFWQLMYGEVTAMNVREVRVGLRRDDGAFPIKLLLKIFPSTKLLAMPSPISRSERALTTDRNWVSPPGDNLEHLEFRRLSGGIRPTPQLTMEFLFDCVTTFTKLRRICAPEEYFKLDEDESLDQMEELEKLMASRVPTSHHDDSGIYPT